MKNLGNILSGILNPSTSLVVLEVEITTGYCGEDTTDLVAVGLEEVEADFAHRKGGGLTIHLTISPSASEMLQEYANDHANMFGHYVGDPDDPDDGNEYGGAEWAAILFSDREFPYVGIDSDQDLVFLQKHESGLPVDLWVICEKGHNLGQKQLDA